MTAPKAKELKIITFDIETAPLMVYSWNLWPEGLSHDNIVNDWYIISAAWKTLGTNTVQSKAIAKPGDDKAVVLALRNALAEADVLVGHNIDKFDIKKLNSRLIYHSLPPLPPIPTVDTLKVAKRIGAFTSNRLDYLAKFLIGEGKIHTEFSLWIKVVNGDKKALKQMVEYNKMDVVRNEEVYLALRPYMGTHPHVGVLLGNDRALSCPKCGDTKMKRNGVRVSASGVKKQECQCQKCGSYHRIPFK